MGVIAVGHRGTAIGVPENSIASHNLAYEFGARGIEFDIQYSKDGEFVVFHDPNVKNKTNGEGKVKDMTLEQLKELRLLSNGETTSHQIPTLREALMNVQNRFMVDLDFKDGPSNSGKLLKEVLEGCDFHRDGSPLVTIFCRDEDAYEKLKPLNDLYSVRPLYVDKHQAKNMSDAGIRVMGLRNHQFTSKRAGRIGDLGMFLFTNAMKLNVLDLIREVLGLPIKKKKPKLKELHEFYGRALKNGSSFIQTDYLPELVEFLRKKNAYEDLVLDRNFQPIAPIPQSDQGPAIV